MIKEDKIAFLQTLTVFGTRKWTALTRWIFKKLVTKKPTTQKWSVPFSISSVNLTKYTSKCGFCHIY